MSNIKSHLGTFYNLSKTFINSKSPRDLRIKRISKIIALIILLGLLFWIVPFRDILEALLTANPLYLVIGMFLGFVVTFMRTYQLGVISWKQGINLNIWQLFALDLVIKFYLLFMPTSLIGGGMRWYKLAQSDGKSTGAFVSVTFNRMFDTFLIIFMGGGFLLLSGQKDFSLIGTGLVVLTIVTIMAWFLIMNWSLRLLDWIQKKRLKTEKIIRSEWVFRNLEKLLIAFLVYADFSRFEMTSIIFVGIARMLIGVVSYQLLALSVGIDLTFADIGWIRSVVLLASLLPFSFAGGLGVREISMVALLSGLGIGADLALAYSFLLFVRGVLIAVFGGIIEAFNVFILDRSSLMDAAHNDGKG
jgi:uncharacterized protein (TIRG00374 family)